MKRNLMFKILLTLIVGCFLSIDAFAQQMTVKGLVKDTNYRCQCCGKRNNQWYYH